MGSVWYVVLGLFAVLSVVLVLQAYLKRRNKKLPENRAPGPRPLPVIGSLHLLAAYDLPYQALDALATQYGPVVGLKLGRVPCLVVSSLRYVKEVLLTKGDHFDGRPDFVRYHKLFSGDKQNCEYPVFLKSPLETYRLRRPRFRPIKYIKMDGRTKFP